MSTNTEQHSDRMRSATIQAEPVFLDLDNFISENFLKTSPSVAATVDGEPGFLQLVEAPPIFYLTGEDQDVDAAAISIGLDPNQAFSLDEVRRILVAHKKPNQH